MPKLSALLLAAALPVAAFAQSADVTGSDGTNSTGYLSCAVEAGAQPSECGFEMLRDSDGSFTLRVLLPGGTVRYLYGSEGRVTSTDSTAEMTVQRFKQRTVVHIVPNEVMDIPNSFLDGDG